VTKAILWQQRFVNADEAEKLGFVTEVVPRAELESATQALGERIAEMDPFLARMIKFSVNQAQDAQGFHESVRGAFSNYMLAQMAGTIAGPENRDGGRRRLPGVEKALENRGRES
jgi:enoyl-CoA hydratase